MANERELTPEEIAKKYHKQNEQARKKHSFGYVKTPTEYQMEVSECGAASLSMILQYNGRYEPLEKLRVETGVSRNGCNAKNIYIAGEKYGFKVTASSRNVDKLLEKNQPPCMLHWNFSHFVVFEGIKHDKYILNDPQYGRRKLTREEFEEGYSGTVLQFEKTEKFVKGGTKRSLLSFVKKRLVGQEKTLWALLLIGIALILPGVLNPIYSQVFVDEIIVESRFTWMKWLLLMMGLTIIFDSYFSYLSAKLTLLLRTKTSLLTTDSMIGHMLRLPMEFYEQRYAGDLVGRVYNNIAVSSFVSGQLVGVIVSLLTSAVYLAIMLAYSPYMALVGLAFSVFSCTVAIFASKKIVAMTLKFGMDTGKLYGTLYNGLASVSSLKAVGAEGEYVGRLLGYYAEVNNNDQKLGRLQTTLDTLPSVISAINTVALLVIGSRLVVEGDLTPGGIMAFTGFLGSFSSPFSSLVSFVRSMQQVKNDMVRVEDIMNYPEEDNYTSPKEEKMEGARLTGNIDIDDVSFSYGKLDKPFIKDFTFHIQSGQSVALVGNSGCGKSTVAKMLSCLYRPWSGKIMFDGVELSEIPRETINCSVAVVTQNISLFEGSIYDNITTWNKAVKREDVIQAAKDACIYDEIMKKKGGFDYVLKENGSNISGGQRQRVEIAKALALNPTILILDEATSALDVGTEKEILDNIRRRRCTMVIVAQRLSTIRDCDEILLMERGVIKERGTHEQLLEKNGKYAALIADSE